MFVETERLILRNWEEKDCKDLYEFASDKDVTKYLHYKTYSSIQDAVDRITKLMEDYKTTDLIGDFAIELKELNKVIGSFNIIKNTDKAGGIVSLGWSLNKKFHGFGYMTETVLAVFRYIKENKIAKRITACHDIENFKSGNVMKRAGMTFEGISRRAGDNNYHSRYDVANYSILDEEIK